MSFSTKVENLLLSMLIISSIFKGLNFFVTQLLAGWLQIYIVLLLIHFSLLSTVILAFGTFFWKMNNQITKFFKKNNEMRYPSKTVKLILIISNLIFMNFALESVLHIFLYDKIYEQLTYMLTTSVILILEMFQTCIFYYLADTNFEG